MSKQDLIGQTIDEWIINDFVASGSAGDVYKAVSKYDGKVVALKLLNINSSFSDKLGISTFDKTLTIRFAREIKTMTGIKHPNIAQVYDYNLDCNTPYVATEFISGYTLEAYVKKFGPISGVKVVDLFTKLSLAMQYLHQKKIVHRDIKPANIMIKVKNSDQGVPDLEPYIIDFSIAQELDDTRLTKTGSVMGTLGYSAPEVLSGNAPDKNADYWSLAATLAFTILGQAPFGTKPQKSVLANIYTGKIIYKGNTDQNNGAELSESLGGINEQVITILSAMLRADVSNRLDFETGLDLLDNLAGNNAWLKCNDNATTEIIKTIEQATGIMPGIEPKNDASNERNANNFSPLVNKSGSSNNAPEELKPKSPNSNIENNLKSATDNRSTNRTLLDPLISITLVAVLIACATIAPLITLFIALLLFIVLSPIGEAKAYGFAPTQILKPFAKLIPTMIINIPVIIGGTLLGYYLEYHTNIWQSDDRPGIITAVLNFFTGGISETNHHWFFVLTLLFSIGIPIILIFYGVGSKNLRFCLRFISQKIIPYPWTLLLSLAFFIVAFFIFYASLNSTGINFWPLPDNFNPDNVIK